MVRQQMLHIIKDSLQQVANTYKLKSRENGPDTASPSFPGDKNNEARTRRFQKLLARRLCLGNSCLPFPFKISICSVGAVWCMRNYICGQIQKDPGQIWTGVKKGRERVGVLDHLPTLKIQKTGSHSPHTYKLNDKWTLTYGKHLRFY